MTARAAILLFALLAPTVADASVLCITRGGAVKARVACRRRETVLNPADFGLCTCGATTTTTTLVTPGTCAFKGTSCTTDAECGIGGLCAPEGDCRHACTSGCPDSTFCFNAAQVGNICVGCGGDNSKCTTHEVCKTAAGDPGNDCVMHGNPDCTGTGGTPCTIPDPCVH